MKYFTLIICFLYFLSYYKINSQKITTKEIITKLLEWGKENNFTLPSFIDISEDKDPKFITKKVIEKNETLFIIPNNIMFTTEKALNLLSSKKLKNQFHKIKREEFIYIEFEDEEYRKEESFLSYILYLMEFKPKKYQKTKFYEEYKYYLEALKIRPRIKPLFFDNDTLEKLYMTYLNTLYKSIKRDYEEEIFIFKGESYNNKDIDYEDYLPHRINVHNKGIKINGHKAMIPFFNFFETDYISYNANYTIEKDGSIRIYSKKNIQKYEEIIIASKKQTNQRSLLFEGKTYDKLTNYFDEYLIPAFSISLYYRFDIVDKDLENQYFINLKEDDFDENAVEIYKDNINILKDEYRKDNNVTYGYLYEILINNIKSYNEYIKNFNLDKIYEFFAEPEIRPHITRIIKGESNILEKANSLVRKRASKYIDLTNVTHDEDIVKQRLEEEEKEKKAKKEKEKKEKKKKKEKEKKEKKDKKEKEKKDKKIKKEKNNSDL